MNVFEHIGSYVLLMRQVLMRPDRHSLFMRQLVNEIQKLGFDSLGIVAIISVFMGMVVTIQTAYNIDSPLIPLSMVGFTARQSVILEFSPTIISLILAGKVGGSIASEIGTMRVTEQIDALEVMGINSANFLILPKVIAAMMFNPVLIIFSIGMSLLGGYFVALFTTLFTPGDYVSGLRLSFESFTLFYALIKTVVFAFLITTVSAYQGYIINGGALEVGRSSTTAVVRSSILIILFNLILTQLLLT
ncbi:MAG TPA: ABC transporter permease [Bacteroidales bacterium]|nr:MAG: ABC transporter permease [Bacteroidetes bacterium GWE2_42_24]OFY27356.1 MAG: ABC transporter permease [Bacteroidetes bacterium GWF2_43_11]PKP21837.1 MAG: ABC transporter permease [Bacteroidetes bacterium HGW-Bacteroidetes-22]HAQ65015.1 ABC transporter permease [Bacteroidales bacterium]HBZ65888.1 ABC transporter permease [Bacteroidales bacterium]